MEDLNFRMCVRIRLRLILYVRAMSKVRIICYAYDTTSFKSSIWRNVPSPWGIWTLKGHFESSRFYFSSRPWDIFNFEMRPVFKTSRFYSSSRPWEIRTLKECFEASVSNGPVFCFPRSRALQLRADWTPYTPSNNNNNGNNNNDNNSELIITTVIVI